VVRQPGQAQSLSPSWASKQPQHSVVEAPPPAAFPSGERASDRSGAPSVWDNSSQWRPVAEVAAAAFPGLSAPLCSVSARHPEEHRQIRSTVLTHLRLSRQKTGAFASRCFFRRQLARPPTLTRPQCLACFLAGHWAPPSLTQCPTANSPRRRSRKQQRHRRHRFATSAPRPRRSLSVQKQLLAGFFRSPLLGPQPSVRSICS
jgi:hypothetical protein